MAEAGFEPATTLEELGHSYSGWHLTNRDPGEWAVPNAAERLGNVDVPRWS